MIISYSSTVFAQVMGLGAIKGAGSFILPQNFHVKNDQLYLGLSTKKL